MKNNSTGKKALLYTAIICLLALAAFYFLFYRTYQEKTQELRDSNDALSARIADLKIYYDNEEQYVADAETIRGQLVELLDSFPAEVRVEDIIMETVAIENAAEIHYSNVGLSDREVLKEIDASVVLAANQEEYRNEICFIRQNASYSNTTDYDGLKAVVQEILSSEYRLGIENIAYTRNSYDGTLSGVIEVAFYSVTGTGKEYVAPNIPDYLSGTDNIFGYVAPDVTEVEEESEEPAEE